LYLVPTASTNPHSLLKCIYNFGTPSHLTTLFTSPELLI
jgi:hypothetical protein